MLDGSGAIVRCAGSTSSRLEPHIDIELGSYLSLLLIHQLSSCFCAFSAHVQGTEKRVECPSLCWQCLLGLDQQGQWLRSAKATLLRGFTLFL